MSLEQLQKEILADDASTASAMTDGVRLPEVIE